MKPLAREAAISPAAKSGAGRRASILLVDDHPPNLMALEAILEPIGSRLLLASSGAEAVEIASREDLAIVLLDLQMPELDGLETAALFKKNERCRDVPIIILTAGRASEVDVARGYATGAVDFLFKPLDPDVLRSKVSVFVQLHDGRVARERARPRAKEGGRLGERLLAARPTEAIAMVEALVRIQAALSEDLDVAKLAQRLATEAVALTSACGAAVHGVRRSASDDGNARPVATAGRLHDALVALGPTSSVVAPALAQRRNIRIDDVRAGAAADVPRIVGSLIATPIVCSGEVEAVLVLVHEGSEMFGARDEELAAIAATQAAAAFENARLYDAARQARDRAELAELELGAGEARLRIALESAGLGTWEYNPRTGALRLDATCRALLETGAEVSFASLLASVHADDRARVELAFRQGVDPDMKVDVEYRHADGERWISVRGQGIAEQRRAIRLIGVVQDVTAKKRIELERAELLASERSARSVAENANRAKDEFLATVSHELRNPLNAILGWSRVLVEDEELDLGERAKKGLDVILRNAKAQVQLVEDILEVSRIVTGKLRITVAPFELPKVFEACVETMRPAANGKRVSLVAQVDSAVRVIVADEDRIQQILWNLLSNAMKFTPTGGQVTASLQLDGDGVVLRVTDTGEGIAPDFLPFVFDRFRQFDGSTTRTHAGLGLGLAIVRHIAELHGGTVRAESPGRGLGASFTVILPLTPASRALGEDADPPSLDAQLRRQLAAHAQANAKAAPLEGARVLVLDDDADMRDLIAMILEDAGAVVDRVGSVADAMLSLARARPHVAISDLAMPGEDGYAFAQRVRAEPALHGVPLMAMTAYTRPEDRQRVLTSGFDHHVPKPVEPDQLVLAVSEALGRLAGDTSER